MDLKEIYCESVDCIQLGQEHDNEPLSCVATDMVTICNR
jgi:hypothetical protein